MKPRTALIIVLILLCFMIFLVDLEADTIYRQEYVTTSEYHATTGKGGERRNKLHEGIDIWCPDPIIFPALPGVVLKIDNCPVLGKYVIIKHFEEIEEGKGKEEFYTIYAHGETIYYSAVGEVTTKTPIMKQGSTGYSSGDHCHFGAFRIVNSKRVYFDPEKVLNMKVAR